MHSGNEWWADTDDWSIPGEACHLCKGKDLFSVLVDKEANLLANRLYGILVDTALPHLALP